MRAATRVITIQDHEMLLGLFIWIHRGEEVDQVKRMRVDVRHKKGMPPLCASPRFCSTPSPSPPPAASIIHSFDPKANSSIRFYVCPSFVFTDITVGFYFFGGVATLPILMEVSGAFGLVRARKVQNNTMMQFRLASNHHVLGISRRYYYHDTIGAVLQ